MPAFHFRQKFQKGTLRTFGTLKSSESSESSQMELLELSAKKIFRRRKVPKVPFRNFGNFRPKNFSCGAKFPKFPSAEKNVYGYVFFSTCFFSKNQKKFFKVLRSGPYFQGSSVSTRQAQGHLNRAKISNRSKVMAILLFQDLNMFFFSRNRPKKKTLWDSNLDITFERLEIFARFRCPCACLGETELP